MMQIVILDLNSMGYVTMSLNALDLLAGLSAGNEVVCSRSCITVVRNLALALAGKTNVICVR